VLSYPLYQIFVRRQRLEFSWQYGLNGVNIQQTSAKPGEKKVENMAPEGNSKNEKNRCKKQRKKTKKLSSR